MEPAVMEAAGLAAFVETLRERALFERGSVISVARAPGRLDVMGGIADYSGSLVLQWPIHEATRVALRPSRERRISITSLGRGGRDRHCDVPLDLVPHAARPCVMPYAMTNSFGFGGTNASLIFKRA